MFIYIHIYVYIIFYESQRNSQAIYFYKQKVKKKI